MKICRRRELYRLLRQELDCRGVELKYAQFNRLLRYAKDNNRIGTNEYNCEYLDVTVDVWLSKRNI